MWSVKDMFYGESEPVWIMKPEKEDNKKGESKGAGGSQASGGNKKQAEEYSAFSTVPQYPYYNYPDYVPSYIPPYNPPYNPPSQPKKEESSKGGANQQPKKDTRVDLKVPICCGECVETIEAALYRLKGVKSVECDTWREKVTVIATTATPADILMECRRSFKKSRMWTDDD